MNFLLAVLLSTYLAFAGEPSPNFRPCSSSAPVGEIVPHYRIERAAKAYDAHARAVYEVFACPNYCEY